MASDRREEIINGSENWRYLIVRPERAGVRDLWRYWRKGDRESGSKFLESNYSDDQEDIYVDWGLFGEGKDNRLVLVVSIIAVKLIRLFSKPLEWTGYFVDFFLNLLSLNGNLLGLLFNFVRGRVEIPQRGTTTFISSIGYLDGRINLRKTDDFGGRSGAGIEMGNRSLMDLCIMASKLAYENASVVEEVVVNHWKMHFVDFYNGWNDYQKERSTQVFILCDKPVDANLILISFRGTEPFDADDWSTDIDYSWYEIPEVGKVHMGFIEALGLGNRTETATFWQSLQVKDIPGASRIQPPQMVELTAYYAVKNKLKDLLAEHSKAKFIVTGHSLGGALAILFPAVLVLHDELEMMLRLLGVYTFGQPRVGDRKLGSFMAAQLNKPEARYFRVVYCNDVVPRLPYDDESFLYKHFGECLYYNSFYTEQKVEEEPNKNYFGMRYLIPAYMNAVWEFIRGLTIGFVHGSEYEENWYSILLRVVGLALPGLSAHSPREYVNSVRLGNEHPVQMSPLE